jgi:hypothetical protein
MKARVLLIILGLAAVVHCSAINRHFYGGERRLSTFGESGRDLMHMHMQTTPLYGNQTGLEYYYATVFFGS